MNSRKRIGIDLDDVSFEFVRELVTFTNAIKRTTVELSDITNYDCRVMYDSEEEKDEIIGAFYETFTFKNLPFVPGFEKHRDELLERFDTYFITSRYGSAIPITRDLFQRHNLPQNKLFFSREKGNEVKRLQLDAFVDDALHNLDHIVQNSDARPIVYNRPWNKHNTLYTRVHNWDETMHVLREIEGDA